MTFLCSKNGYSHNRVEIVHGLRNQGPKANMTEKLNQSNAKAANNNNNNNSTTTANDDDVNRISFV